MEMHKHSFSSFRERTCRVTGGGPLYNGQEGQSELLGETTGARQHRNSWILTHSILLIASVRKCHRVLPSKNVKIIRADK